MKRTYYLTTALSVVLLLTAHAVAQTQHTNQARGFNPQQVYSTHDIDSINLFNGNLVLSIPVGQRYHVNGNLTYGLTLSYNSNLWTFEEVCPHNIDVDLYWYKTWVYDMAYDVKQGTWIYREIFTQPVTDPGSPRPNNPCWTVSYPNPVTNGGLGWQLNFGQLFPPSATEQDRLDPFPLKTEKSAWVYESPDGSEHSFYDRLHITDPAGGTDYSYTRDGTYLRMHVVGAERQVEFPNGEVHVFKNVGTAAKPDWRATEYRDQFGNWVRFDYTNPLLWVITDSVGRTHTVSFLKKSEEYQPVINTAELAAFDSPQPATYRFEHDVQAIKRGAPHLQGDTAYKPIISVPFLTAIVQPDDSRYSMPVNTADPSASAYDLTGDFSSLRVRGVIRKLTLPTGGRIEWDYRPAQLDDGHGYNYPVFSSSRGYLRNSTGVRVRRVIKGSNLYEWKYDPTLDPIPDLSSRGKSCLIDTESGRPECAPKQFTNTVTNPQGDYTVSYFSVYPHWIQSLGANQPPRQIADWHVNEYGLPFTKYQQQTDSWGKPVFLSQEVFRAGSTSPLRSVYVRYEGDPPPVSDGFGSIGDANRRLVSSRTVYHDDNDEGTKFADVSYADFDGLGHYRTTHTAGNFESLDGTSPQRGKVGDLRIDVIKYNPDRGTYLVDIGTNSTVPGNPNPYTPFPEGSPWVLGTYDRIVSGDYNRRAMSYFYFDALGLLRRKRVLSGLDAASSLVTLRTNDVLVEYGYDKGNLTGEAYYGGDRQNNITTNADEWKTITLLPQNAEYRRTHTYQYGALATSQYAGVTFKSADNDIDQNTGFVKTSRDVSGDPVNYVYDAMGRVTEVRPRQGSWTKIYYTPAGESLPRGGGVANAPTVNVYSEPNGGGTPIREDIYQFDPLGRLTYEQRQMPDSGVSNRVFIARVTDYNGMGWMTSVSEWGRPGARTEYSAFDPFGRAHLITPPDGGGHAIGLSYIGERKVRRTVKVGTTLSGGSVTEQESLTVEVYDRLGRLRSVTEPSGPGGSDVTTLYEYDVNGRLVKSGTTAAPVAGAAQVTQTREFAYDNRGQLLTERLPELGLSGNGVVSYADYDSMGLVGKRSELGEVRRMTYDSAGRMVALEEGLKGGGFRTLKSFTYYPSNGTGSNNYRLGKLQKAARHNWVTHPVSGATIDVEVWDEYTYGGLDGRASKRVSTLNATGPSPSVFEQSYAYDQLGNLSALTYPKCTNTNCANSSDAARSLTVNYSYNRGELTGVAGGGNVYASGITYHPNGSINTVTHGNGVSTVFGLDPNYMQRPASVSTAGVLNNQNWSSGTYRYDGAGNITRTGGDWYVYDKVGRLVEGTALGETATPLAERKKQAYTYDTFGNMLGVKTYANVSTTGSTLTEQSTFPTSASTNRRTDLAYDQKGNVQGRAGDNPLPYGYDALNIMKTAPGKTFIHNADDERVWTIDYSSATWVETYTPRGPNNEVLREYELVGGDALHNWHWVRDYVYRGGQLLAADTPTSRLFYHVDHLGTPRLITDISKRRVSYRQYFPFGGEAVSSGQVDPGRLQFTGHERDRHYNGDTLDYMHLRAYNPAWGRFLGVDPGRDANPARPQSWNSYSYVRNNPVNATDPDGRFILDIPTIMSMLEAQRFHAFTGDELFITLSPPPPMTLSEEGAAHMIQDEGHARGGYGAYDDMAKGNRAGTCVVGGPGNCTVGFGHNLGHGACTAADCKNYAGMTYDQALALFQQDQQEHVDKVNGLLRAPVNQAQFDGLVDFNFNIRSRRNDVSGGLFRFDFKDELTALQFGLFGGVANGMRGYVSAENKRTHRMERMGGLVKRRGWDAAPFDRSFHAFQ